MIHSLKEHTNLNETYGEIRRVLKSGRCEVFLYASGQVKSISLRNLTKKALAVEIGTAITFRSAADIATAEVPALTSLFGFVVALLHVCLPPLPRITRNNRSKHIEFRVNDNYKLDYFVSLTSKPKPLERKVKDLNYVENKGGTIFVNGTSCGSWDPDRSVCNPRCCSVGPLALTSSLCHLDNPS